jgi:SSS family solute:Na+ symporter
MLSNSISVADYLVIVIYIIGIFFLAFKSGKNLTKTSDDKGLIFEQYLAGKSLTFWESLSSIIATEVSALTFLGIPAFAYGSDFSFIQIYMGALIGRILIALIILPKIYNDQITVYATMAKNNGTLNGQRFTAIFYFLNKVLAVGVRLFSGSILVAEFFNLSIYTAVFVICLITFFYTLIGGLKAVVRTDMVQMALFITGGVVAHYIIPEVDGRSWLELMTIATDANKTSFLDFSNPWPFFTGVIGGILFDMATHGVDQDFAQRLTANKSMKSAQRAIILSTFLSISVGLLFLSIGALLWSHYQSVTPPNIGNDQLFAYFITSYFPTGLKGLMVAGVLAATMSTLDSTINALSACFYNDIIHHRSHKKDQIGKFYKLDTFIITVLLMMIAFIASSSDGLLILGLKITSWTAGSLLALFFASVVWQKWLKTKLDTKAVIGAYIFGIIGVYLNNNLLSWPWQWNVYFGFIFAIIFLALLPRLAFSSE